MLTRHYITLVVPDTPAALTSLYQRAFSASNSDTFSFTSRHSPSATHSLQRYETDYREEKNTPPHSNSSVTYNTHQTRWASAVSQPWINNS
jgi:hypothetical protein